MPKIDQSQLQTDKDKQVQEFKKYAKAMRASAQAMMDSAAQAAGYESILDASSYADEPSQPKFQGEGKSFRAWRSNVWASFDSILADVELGKRGQPDEADLLAELPELVLDEVEVEAE